MTDLTIVIARFTGHQNGHAEALKAGCAHLGIHARIFMYGQRVSTRLVACWGWRMGDRLRKMGHEVLVMERGYLGDRFKYTSLAWNGLNGHAEFPEYETDDSRIEKIGAKVLPWKTGGEYGLILGQVPRDASLRGQDMVPHYQKWAAAIEKDHKIPAFIRPHPDLKKKCIQQVTGLKELGGSLSDAFLGARMGVVFNSNSAVDSVLAGVPTVAFDKGTMAYPVCGHNISEIIKPDRTQWLRELSYKQWDIEEMSSGVPLVKLMEMKI